MKRELWVVASTVENAVKVLNAGFCSDGEKGQEWSEDELNQVREWLKIFLFFLNQFYRKKVVNI